MNLMEKEDIKNNINGLVNKYLKILEGGLVSHYNEEETKKDFILPLFSLLGWDVENKKEVSAEEKISGDRVDYGFYINERIAFYLEAKPMRADLNREDYAWQAVKYAWNKGATWAVLTDFESIKVFNASNISENLGDKLVIEIDYKNYESDFDKLWLLSKKSFLSGELDSYAQSIHKKLQKVSVSDSLYKDLNECRDILTKDLGAWNENVPKELLDEGVQKLLDRLIFIRVAEDRGIEPPTLIPLLRQWQASKDKNKITLYQSMIVKFRELDGRYNSNLFSEHYFEKWEEHSGTTEKVINILYGKQGYYQYDFKVMPSDILGAVYENYLGYKLSQSKKKGLTLDKDSKKRKEQGIYYTPSYIVDYIVKNTLGVVLEKCKTMQDIVGIKILDPACGSGSFLIRALDTIAKKQNSMLGLSESEITKFVLLKNNIYGVDFDSQAVEIARLNLLINSLDRQEKMPTLSHNIRNGNSLIFGTNEELKKYFGINYRDKKPFNWQEEFPEVFKQGGFDVIIGNPPYVRNRDLVENEKKYYKDKYQSADGQYDLYQLFFEKAINLLKDGGYLGFITSNKYAITSYGKKLREFILSNCKIISILDVSNVDVFKDASTYPYVIILQKTKNNSNFVIKSYKMDDGLNFENKLIEINQDSIRNSETMNFIIKEDVEFLKEIENKSIKLGEIATIKETIHTGNIRNKLIVNECVDDSCKKLLAGKDCHRYWFKWNKKYVRYDKNLIDKSSGEYANLPDEKYFEEPKILLREIAMNIEACLDKDRYYTLNKVYAIQPFHDENYKLEYLLALLNSSLLSFYFRNNFEEAHVSGGFLQFKKIYTSQIPIRIIDFEDKNQMFLHDQLVVLVNTILNLNKKLNDLEENTDEWEQIKREIDKTDKLIDKEVYDLYELTEEEIKIIEGK